MKKPCKISASTMARTAALALALTNQLLSLKYTYGGSGAGELVGEQQLHPRSH